MPASSYTSTNVSAVPASTYGGQSMTQAQAAQSPAELEAEVQRLRAQLAAAQTGTRSGAVVQKSNGVPVHIVAAIAVGVFAITYLFF